MTIVVPLTDTDQYKNLPVQVYLTSDETGLSNKDSCVECGHIVTIDQSLQVDQVKGVVGRLSPDAIAKVDRALRISLTLKDG